MIPSSFLDQLSSDCTILLKRALLGKTMAVFGVDGFGLHGSSFRGKHFVVNDITVLVTAEDALGDPVGVALISLDGYNSADDGHLSTDQNLKISVNKCLQADHIDPKCWTYAALEFQGADFFVIDLDVPRLLDWA